jgi:hypothetical protein
MNIQNYINLQGMNISHDTKNILQDVMQKLKNAQRGNLVGLTEYELQNLYFAYYYKVNSEHIEDSKVIPLNQLMENLHIKLEHGGQSMGETAHTKTIKDIESNGKLKAEKLLSGNH